MFAGDAVVVALGVVAKKREHEAVLPARGAVARAGVAAAGGKDGNNVLLEGDGALAGGVFDSERDFLALASEFDFDGGGSVGERAKGGAFEFGKLGITEGELGGGADVASGGVFGGG